MQLEFTWNYPKFQYIDSCAFQSIPRWKITPGKWLLEGVC
jgi:hypothetical protein